MARGPLVHWPAAKPPADKPASDVAESTHRGSPASAPPAAKDRNVLAEFFDRNVHSEDLRRILDRPGRSGD